MDSRLRGNDAFFGDFPAFAAPIAMIVYLSQKTHANWISSQ
jgi:hypothetical protein